MMKKTRIKSAVFMLLIIFCLSGCNESKSIEEESINDNEKSVHKVNKSDSSIRKKTTVTETSEETERAVFEKRYVYQFPKTNNSILIPDSWGDAYGVIESPTNILFLHYNDKGIYAPLMEVLKYENKEEWMADKKQSYPDINTFYAELGTVDGVIYGVRIFSLNSYSSGGSEYDDLEAEYNIMSRDLKNIFLKFNYPPVLEAIENGTTVFESGSVFNLEMPYFDRKYNEMAYNEKPADDSEPVIAVHAVVPEKNDLFAFKYGYINKHGKFVISPIYDKLTPFEDGVAIVAKDNLYGIIDKSGASILEIKYDNLKNYGEGYVVYRDNSTGTEGYMDLEGNIVIPAQYREAFAFKEGRAVIRDNNGLYGYVDSRGDVLIPAKYNDASPYNEGIALVNGDGKNTYFDSDGVPLFEIEKPPMYPEAFVATDFVNGVAFKRFFPRKAMNWTAGEFDENEHNIKWVMIDKENILVNREKYCEIGHSIYNQYDTANQLISVESFNDWMIIDMEGRVISKTDYDYMNIEENGYVVMKKGRWGLLDSDLKVVISPIFDEMGDFNNGVAKAELCGMKFVINESGEVVWCQIDISDVLSNVLLKIFFEMEDVQGASIIQLFDYEIEDFQIAFKDQYVIGPSGPEGAYTGLYFESQGIELVFIEESLEYINLNTYKELAVGDKFDKVLASLGDTEPVHIHYEAQEGFAETDEYVLNYNIGDHLLRFTSANNETVDSITVYGMDFSTHYFGTLETDVSEEVQNEDIQFTIIKNDESIDLSKDDRPLLIAKQLEDKTTLYFDLELLTQILEGQYTENDKTGTVRIDYSDTTYYYTNQFWQNKNGDYYADGEGTIRDDGHYYLEGRQVHKFFGYGVVWDSDNNEVSINHKSYDNETQEASDVPPNKMRIIVGDNLDDLDKYAETFVVKDFLEIYKRHSEIIPKVPNTKGDFGMKIIQNYIAEESGDYTLICDAYYDSRYVLRYEDNRYREGTSFRLREGENILEHQFQSYFPRDMTLEKCPPYVNEDVLIIQLKGDLSSKAKIVYVMDRINKDDDNCIVNIAPSDEPIVLCLSSCEQVNWSIENNENVVIEAILFGIHSGKKYRSTVAGDIENIPIYYTDKLPAPKKIIVGNQAVPKEYALEQGDIEKRMVALDQQVQKLFNARPYSFTYMDESKTTETDQIILDEAYYEFFDQIVERVQECENAN